MHMYACALCVCGGGGGGDMEAGGGLVKEVVDCFIVDLKE